MFRIRAVESPPDAAGVRRIWHRGTRGAELVTVVDAKGRVVQQEFVLFDDTVRWDKDLGLRYTRVEVVEGSGQAPPALITDEGGVRLTHFRAALEAYSGSDRFIQHLRDHLVAKASGATLGQRPPITREMEPVAAVAPVKEGRARHLKVVLIAVGVVLIMGLAFIAWRS